MIDLKPGDRVRMSERLKDHLRLNHESLVSRGVIEADAVSHVDEFGGCVGVVEGPCDYGGGRLGPEVDVRWEPSGLRYGYPPSLLDVARGG